MYIYYNSKFCDLQEGIAERIKYPIGISVTIYTMIYIMLCIFLARSEHQEHRLHRPESGFDVK